VTVKKSLGTGTAAVIAATVLFLPGWEGMDKVAKRDMIGTGHPITYCYGQTAEFGVVKVGTRFTKAECDAKLAESLPKYLDQIGPCVHRPVPIKVMASLLDGSWNGGPRRVCTSPMVAKINAGNIRAGCNAFDGWLIHSDGVVRPGLIARRDGELHGDKRKSERALCLEGANDPKSEMYSYSAPLPAPRDPPTASLPKPRPVESPKRACWFWRCK
jgi:lysozyme